ncbi:MAG TPA: prolyl oligopeptidase family serine peptidase [Caulobacteraceae bacterium]|nr:prolyl oligopeptidase family serine peptidase [Caulobacteraceae bacterium]
MLLNRRHLLASAAAVGATAAATRRAWADAPAGPPRASVRPVTETMHGVAVTDRYRWMETPSDPEWTPYLMGQNAYARGLLATIPGRDQLADKISAVSGAVAAIGQVQSAGPYIFTQVRPLGANTFKLYVREGVAGQDRLLIDPDTLAGAGTHYSLDYWTASPDGKLVAYGTSAAGSENSALRFIETATGTVLPEVLDRAQFGPANWSPDGSGVFINRLKAGTKHGDPDHYLDSICWFHKVGTDPAGDVKVLGKGLDPAVDIPDIAFTLIASQPGCDIALGVVANGVQNELTCYASPVDAAMAGKPVWKKVCVAADDVTGLAVVGPDLYLLTHKDASRYRVVQSTTANPGFAGAAPAAAESESVVKGLSGARDGLYVQTLNGGLSGLYRLAPDGKNTPVQLPFEGSIAFVATDPLADGAWFMLEGWVRPPVLCHAGPDGAVTVTDIAPKPAIDVSGYASVEVRVKARDGAMVPLSILYAKTLKRNGKAPLLLDAYGAYGLDQDAGFIARALPWLDLGGVFAVAHVRGGGELGEAWHLAGQKLTKPNTWRDAIDCAEYMVAERWTGRGKIAVEGGSAGGIMVGRFLTERPDLVTVAISQVGVSNATRAEFSENGPDNVPEFGTVKDPDGFKGLYEMDAYQHVKDGTRYPAVLLTTGANDPRVAPWEAGKMAARLQSASSSKKPVILRVETDAGHGIGSTRKQRDDETADTYAFILWQTGDPRFQPKG